MRRYVAIGIVALLPLAGAAFQGGAEDGRAIVAKAIAAAGGEAKIAKYQTGITKEKGTYYGRGNAVPFTGTYWNKYPQFKMEITGVMSMGLDGGKGWLKSKSGLVDLTKDEFELEQWKLRAGWITTLAPLKDTAYTLSAEGSAKVGEQAATVVKVLRDGYPTVKLYFDRKTFLLLKSEYRSRSIEQNLKEIQVEVYFSEFKMVDGAMFAHKYILKHDGKMYATAEVTEMKAADLDAKIFAKPAK